MTNNSTAFCEDYIKGIKIKSAFFLIFYILFFHILGASIIALIDNKSINSYPTFYGYLFMFIIVIILFFKTFRQSVSSIKVSFNKNLNYLVIIFFITLTLMVISGIFLSYIDSGSKNEIELGDEFANNRALMFVAAVVFAPIVEELVFRFINFRAISNKSIVLACVISSIIFGFYHVDYYIIVEHDYSQFAAMLPTFSLGLGCAVVYAKTKNLAYPIALHMAMNFVASTG